MVAALILAAATVVYPPPVAAFTAPASAVVGETISFSDQSYDPAPGHHIVLQIWLGRTAFFSSIGAHTVSLLVEDDRGLWGETSRTIYVTSRGGGLGRPSSGAGLTASPATVRRGDKVTLLLTAAPAARSIHLTLPAAFTPQIPLPSGVINYSSINAGIWILRNGTWQTNLWLPWTSDYPLDGTYAVAVRYEIGGSVLSATASIVVHGTDRLAFWRLTTALPSVSGGSQP